MKTKEKTIENVLHSTPPLCRNCNIQEGIQMYDHDYYTDEDEELIEAQAEASIQDSDLDGQAILMELLFDGFDR